MENPPALLKKTGENIIMFGPPAKSCNLGEDPLA